VWNSHYTSDGNTNYRIWVDLWGGVCRNVATHLERNRPVRHKTLRTALSEYASKAKDYSENMKLAKDTASSSKKVETSIADMNTKISADEASIKSLTDKATTLNSAQTKAQLDLQNAKIDNEFE